MAESDRGESIDDKSSRKPERRLGPFILKEKLGGGGMGVVYRAIFTKENREVALKLLPPNASEEPRLVARFDREVEILRKLKHPNIVRYYGGGKIEGQRWMAMQLLPGGSLASELRKRGVFPWQEVVRIGLAVCSALEHAHEHGIIHRDLKPSNLLLTDDGRLKLADFGIARDTDATGLTAEGKTVGTFAYMSPELIRGFPPACPKTDLYALGCVLFQLLTGRPPFESDNPTAVLYAHIQQKPPRATEVALDCPIWLDSLIQQMLEKDPDKRPRDAASVALALREVEQKVRDQQSLTQHVAAGGPTALNVTAETATVRKLLKPKRKKKSVDVGRPFYERTWFLAAGLALILGLVVWTFWPKSEEQLVASARALMESSDPTQWDRARERYLVELSRRFPEGSSAPQVQEWTDRIEMHKAEERLKYKLKIGREFDSEGERLFAKARQYEQFGDRITALERYQALVTLLQDDESNRAFVNLAKRQIAGIQTGGNEGEDRLQIVRDALGRAEEMHRDGQTVPAREIWQSIVRLYGENQELRPLVNAARARLEDRVETPGSPTK